MSSFASLASSAASKSDGSIKSASAKAKLSPVSLKMEKRNTLKGHFSKICSVAWTAGGSLLSAAQDGKLICWNPHEGFSLFVWIHSCMLDVIHSI
jgi:WD40 repeat protein